MAGGPLNQAIPGPGVIANEATPETLDLYVTPADLSTLYGLCVEEQDVRAAMTIIHAHTNRPSLWPERYSERLTIPDGYNVARCSARPVAELLGVRGRYAPGRRDQRSTLPLGMDYYAALAVLGTGTTWQTIDVEAVDVDVASGELVLPVGFLPVWYTEVQVEYMAGFVRTPDRVKLAVAEIINSIRSRGASDRTFYAVGKIQSTWAGTGYLSIEARRLLAPYVVQALY